LTHDFQSRGDRDPSTISLLAVRAMPAVFVFLWSTGFIVAKLALPYSPPLTFLLLRFCLVIALMLPLSLIWRAPWPRSLRQAIHIAVAGALLHGGYLAGVFCSIDHGQSAGLTSLIVGVQPVLTGFAGRLIGERVTARQWLGLLLGFAGVALVVANRKLVFGLDETGIALSLMALLSITAGTLYQKRYCGAMDLRTGSVMQFSAAALLLLPFAVFEVRAVQWSASLVFALGWSVVVMSLGAISLLYLLIRRGAATHVSSLFYLTPPTTAIMAYFIFGETLTATALLGLLIAVIGVAIVVRR
jgi:drug/metabolite transporter (DMT)-like permease